MWSYSNDPENEPVDEIRLLVGDTVQATALLQDEEIEYLLAMYPKPDGKPAYLAAAAACDAILGRMARLFDKSVDVISKSESQKFDHYQKLAVQFRDAYRSNGRGTANGYLSTPILGGGGSTVLGDSRMWTPNA